MKTFLAPAVPMAIIANDTDVGNNSPTKNWCGDSGTVQKTEKFGAPNFYPIREEWMLFVLPFVWSSFHLALASHCLTGSRVVDIAAAISFKVNPDAFNSNARRSFSVSTVVFKIDVPFYNGRVAVSKTSSGKCSSGVFKEKSSMSSITFFK